ncbi:MAG TPA: DUF4292 domain-containing protein [Candidatus Binatia bacterium]
MRFPSRFTRSAKLVKVLILATVLGIAGCATVTPPQQPKLPAPEWDRAKLLDSVSERVQQFRSIKTLAQVDYSGPDGKHGFQEAVLVERPDRLRLETLSFLGAILIVTANSKELVGYHPREGIFVRGDRTKDNLRRYTQIPLDLEEITMLLIGLPPVDPKMPANQEGNALIFSRKDGKRDVVAFESQQPVPTKWERLNAGGSVELSAEFSDYIQTPAGLFPSQIVFQANLQRKKIQIRYQQPEINATISPELFSQQKPANVQEVPIEAIGS